MLTKIKKRDGRIVDFEPGRIARCIVKAAEAIGYKDFTKEAQRLEAEIVGALELKFNDENPPDVETTQDYVEEALMRNGYFKIAKAYHDYRVRHNELRAFRSTFFETAKIVDDYTKRSDWRVCENSNLVFSIGGLVFHVASSVIARFVLDKVYPPEISDSHVSGDFHIHDLGFGIAGYCAGWSMGQLLLEGFNAPGRLHSNPPKHLNTALIQMINFLGTLQNEWAGAQAFNSVDVYLAPFVREDKLDFRKVKQEIQQFIYNLNVTSRWGGQCVSEDTEALTLHGWKKYYEIDENDMIATFNLKNGKIEFQKPQRINVFDYDGHLIRLKNRIQDQLVTPNHRVVRKKFNSEKFVLEDVESILKLKTHAIVPISGYSESTWEIDDNLVKLIAWIVSDGSLDDGRGRVCIFQSLKYPENCEEIRGCLKALNLSWDESSKLNIGFAKHPLIRFRLSQSSSRWVKKYVKTKVTPQFILSLSPRQIKLYVDTYAKGDGSLRRRKITPENPANRDIIQALCCLCGYGTTLRKRRGEIITIVKHNTTYITRIERVKYKGKVWCPTTKNGTFVARRNGKVFITGNSPFTNITLSWNVPEDLANQPAIVGGKPLDRTYSEFEEEIALINRAFIEVLSEGDAKQRPFSFPIPTYNLTKDFKWDSELSRMLFGMAGKFGLPYFQNFVNSDLRPEDLRSLCCRLQLRLDELRRNVTGGLFGSSDSTGSVGVVTINMPRLGYLSKDEDEFFERLAYLMELAKRSLEHKREFVEKNIKNGLLPYTKRYLGSLRNHFSTIGLVGMHEALLNMFGFGIDHPDGRAFAIKTLKFMREKTVEFQKETGHLYNLEATPAEGTSYRLAKIDKQKYPDIITSGESVPFYTNSTQLPVNSSLSLFEALRHQEELQTLYTGGTVFHIFLGEAFPDPEGVGALLKKIVYKTRLPYLTLTPTYSICPDHGYISGEHFKCPICGRDADVYSRVVGYYRPVQNWNIGKREEFRLRNEYEPSKL
jgi:ribonucleoside-triphosphate reductase